MVVLRRPEQGHLENLKPLESIIRNGSKSCASSFFVWPSSAPVFIDSARVQKERLFHLPSLYVSLERLTEDRPPPFLGEPFHFYPCASSLLLTNYTVNKSINTILSPLMFIQ